MEVIFFFLLTAALAIACHVSTRHWWLATLLAAVWSATAYQCVVRLHLGYWDPFAVIAWVVQIGLGLIISGIVAIPFLVIRRNRRSK